MPVITRDTDSTSECLCVELQGMYSVSFKHCANFILVHQAVRNKFKKKLWKEPEALNPKHCSTEKEKIKKTDLLCTCCCLKLAKDVYLWHFVIGRNNHIYQTKSN